MTALKLPWNSTGQFFGWLFVVALLVLIIFSVYRYITREDRELQKRSAERRRQGRGGLM